MKLRKVRLGRTAWGALNALMQNNGRGFVNWGKRYPELSPGRAVMFSQVYHSLFAQELVTRKGCNHPGDAVITERGIIAYMHGSIDSVPPKTTSYLDESAAEPAAMTGEAVQPRDHRWAREFRISLPGRR